MIEPTVPNRMWNLREQSIARTDTTAVIKYYESVLDIAGNYNKLEYCSVRSIFH